MWASVLVVLGLCWSSQAAQTTVTTRGEQCHIQASRSNDMDEIDSFESTVLLDDGTTQLVHTLKWEFRIKLAGVRIFLLSPSSLSASTSGGSVRFSSSGIQWGAGKFKIGSTLTIVIANARSAFSVAEVTDDSCGSGCTCFRFEGRAINAALPTPQENPYSKVHTLQLQPDATIAGTCSDYVATSGNELDGTSWEIDVLFVYANLGTQRDQIPYRPWGWVTATQKILDTSDVNITLNIKGFVRVTAVDRGSPELRKNHILRQWARYYKADIVVVILDTDYGTAWADQFNLVAQAEINGGDRPFILTQLSISSTSYEFAYTLGKNLGCANNLAQGPMFEDALGYTHCIADPTATTANPEWSWSTIMGDRTCYFAATNDTQFAGRVRRYSNKDQGEITLWDEQDFTATVFNDCACAMRYSAQWVSKLSDAYDDVECPQFEIFTRNHEINNNHYAEVVSTTASRTNWWNSAHGVQFREFEGPSTLAVLSVDALQQVTERLETCLDSDDAEGCIENHVTYWVGVEGEDGTPEEVAGLPEGEEGLINRANLQTDDVNDQYYGTLNCDKADNPEAALGFFALGLNTCNGKQQNNGGGCTGPYCGLVKTLVHFDNVCQRVARDITSTCEVSLEAACLMIADNDYTGCPAGKPLQNNANYYEGKCGYEDIPMLCTCLGCADSAADVAAKRRHRLKALGKSHKGDRHLKGKGGKITIQQSEDEFETFVSGDDCYEYSVPYPLGQNFFGQPLCPKMNTDGSNAWSLFVPSSRDEMDFVIDVILSKQSSQGAWTGLTDLRIVGSDPSAWENRFSAIAAIKPPILRQFRRGAISGTGDTVNALTALSPPQSDRDNNLCPQNSNCALVLDVTTRQLIAVDTTGGLYTILCRRECTSSV